MPEVIKRGWFTIPGEQEGHRSLDEQLMGLAPLVSEIKGKSVLDLGCAEGLILQHMKESGAARCVGYDNNKDLLEIDQKALNGSGCELRFGDLNVLDNVERFDVVLMLAILHKLQNPEKSLIKYSDAACELIVIRLPYGSDGEITWKHGRHMQCDTRSTLKNLGFTLERDEEGPREERVHYWRR